MSRLTSLTFVASMATLIGGPALAEAPAIPLGPVGSMPNDQAVAASPTAPAVSDGAVETDAASSEPLVFSMLVDTKRLKGEFTPIGDIPGGSFEITDTSLDPETGTASATYVLDPAPKGGDTLTVETVGSRLGELPRSHAEYGRTAWSVTEAGGEYQQLAGSHGLAFFTQDVSWRVVTLVAMDEGSDTPAT